MTGPLPHNRSKNRNTKHRKKKKRNRNEEKKKNTTEKKETEEKGLTIRHSSFASPRRVFRGLTRPQPGKGKIKL